MCRIGSIVILLALVISAVMPTVALADESKVRVLMVTGVDYKGHKWQETAPALVEVLKSNPRMEVTKVEDFNALATETLTDYDVLFIHFKNYEAPKDYPTLKKNLTEYVNGGGGLFFFHFACGAFEDWPEFVQIAGRVWYKNLRGHDPRGEFTVSITDRDHPSMEGIGDFKLTDELYTCLGGETPIHVVATAVSKVDQKTYPMAFTLNYGKGRIFHTPLGHDTIAIGAEGLKKLVIQGTLWAADAMEDQTSE